MHGIGRKKILVVINKNTIINTLINDFDIFANIPIIIQITPNIIEIIAVITSGLTISIIPNNIKTNAIIISVQPDFFSNFSNMLSLLF